MNCIYIPLLQPLKTQKYKELIYSIADLQRILNVQQYYIYISFTVMVTVTPSSSVSLIISEK